MATRRRSRAADRWYLVDWPGPQRATGGERRSRPGGFFRPTALPEPLAFPTDRQVLAELQAGASDRIPDSPPG
ncbi:MAG: hypothetical protein MUC53_00570 [Candidatus Contendobacter sp.]|nr:hypothetical protein [Candidatus Contendobacter sp.]